MKLLFHNKKVLKSDLSILVALGEDKRLDDEMHLQICLLPVFLFLF